MAQSEHTGEIFGVVANIYDSAVGDEPLPRLLDTMARHLDLIGLDLVVEDETGDPVPAVGAGGTVRSLGQVGGDLGLLVAETGTVGEAEAAGPITLGHFRRKDGKVKMRLMLTTAAKPRADRPPLSGATLAAIAGHLRRAFQLHRKLLAQQVRGDSGKLVLDAVPLGTILVNGAGQILQTNASADHILAERDGLASDRNSLIAGSSAETARLRRVITQVASVDDRVERTPVGVLRIERPSLGPAMLLAVVPVRAGRRDEGVADLAVVFVSDGARAPEIPPEVIERMFGLTPAEARLLVALVNGQSLDDTAQIFGVSKNTLRNQLNQVFRKTGTTKQSELMRLVLTSPATVLMNVARDRRRR
jgi:DNA-binding CsgD family transcriptional regulator